VTIFPDGEAVVLAQVSNLLENGDFEGGLSGWFSFSGASVSVQSLVARGGSRAALAAGRTQAYMGIGTNVMDVLSQGNVYVISAWFRLAAGAAEDNAVITMMQQDDSGVSYIQIGAGKVTDAGWTKVEGVFTLDVSESRTELVLYFEGPKPGVNFYADDAVLSRRTGDWRVEANEGIERNRKRDMRIAVVDSSGAAVGGASLRIRQVRRHFAFGTAVNERLTWDQKYRDFVEEHFEWTVPEDQGKWYHNEPNKGDENYEAMDAMYAFCAERDITMRGHSIFWAVEKMVQEWVKALDDAALRKALERRIASVVGRYAGKVVHWDVNNEMLHGSYFKDRLGDAIRPWIFQKMKEADPDAMSFVNDFNVVTYTQTDAYKTHIQDLMDAGAQIEGIGAQGHFDASVDPYDVRARLDSLAELGLPIWITEYDAVNSDPDARADALEKLYRTAFAHPAVGGVLMWGFYAKAHWRGADAAIVDEDWTVNAAGEMYQALMEEWTTTGAAVTGTNGVADFRGYHGKYEVDVLKPSLQTSEIYLAPGDGPGRYTIELEDPCVHLKKGKCKKKCVFTKTPKKKWACLPKTKQIEHACAQYTESISCREISVCKFANGKCFHRCDGKGRKKCTKDQFCTPAKIKNPCLGCQLEATCGSRR